MRRYVMPHIDIQFFKGQLGDSQNNAVASVRLKQNNLQRNFFYQQYMHMYPPNIQQQYFAQNMMYQYQQQQQQQLTNSSNSMRPGSVNSSTGGSGFQNRSQQSVATTPQSQQQQQLSYNPRDDPRFTGYYFNHQEFYNYNQQLQPPPPPFEHFWNQNYIRQQNQQQQSNTQQPTTTHHQKRSTNYTTQSYDSYYNYYDQQNRASIDSIQHFHNYQPSTASVIYNPAAGGGDQLQTTLQIGNSHQDNDLVGHHSRSNTDTQLPSSTMIQRNSCNNQKSIDFNSPMGSNLQTGIVDKRHNQPNAEGTNLGASNNGGGSLSSAANGVRFAWGSGYPFVHSGCPLFPTNSWMESNSSGGGGGGRRFNNSTFSNGSGYSPHFGSGNYFYDFSPHAFYAKGGNRSGSPEHNRTVSFLNVNSNPGSMDLTGANGNISGGVSGDIRQQQLQQKILKGQSQLGAAVGSRLNSIGGQNNTASTINPSKSRVIKVFSLERDLRPEIQAAANPESSSGTAFQSQKNNSDKQQNERLNTSGVLEEESIVKSIQQIIDSQEAKDSNESPSNFEMIQSKDDKEEEEYIKIIEESPKNFDQEFDMQMQIPSEQGGVWGPVPVWGGINSNNNQGHLKAFSTDFWVWSKRQVQNPAQQTKYFSTNQGNNKSQWDKRQSHQYKQQSHDVGNGDDDTQKLQKTPQKLEEIKELHSDIDSNL